MDTYIGKSSGKGRGVFAAKQFKESETIEIAPVLVLPHDDEDLVEIVDSSILKDYLFDWGEKGGLTAIAFGSISMCNHSYSPNAQYIQDYDKQMIILESMKQIEEGEEITINYNGDPEDQTPCWGFRSET